jgi:hypothetical protein
MSSVSPAGTLTERQVPFTGPYGPPEGSLKSKGATAEAMKRAMSRLGHLPWTDFDQHWNEQLVDAYQKWRVEVGLEPSKQYGEAAWEKIREQKVPRGRPHEGEWALDGYAQKLIQDEAGETAGGDHVEKVQAAIAEFAFAIIGNEPNIGYSQDRPIKIPIDPNAHFESDCSGIPIQAFNFAAEKTGLPVPDPSKHGYNGGGNTDSSEDDHEKVGAPYRIGDLAHFHSDRHVILCIKPGDQATAEWVSHGREAGPELVRLATYSRFPGEFMFVVRPPLLDQSD